MTWTREQRQAIMATECPSCRARPFARCFSIVGGGVRHNGGFHKARTDLAVKEVPEGDAV